MAIFDDLALLRSFTGIVESGSLSAAARAMRLTQPTLSRRLKTLEARCGAELLRRDAHGMSLTEAGRKVLEEARGLLNLAQESEQRLQSDRSALAGEIRLFATIDFGQSVVSRLAASFLEKHPGVTMELAYSNRPAHMIEEGCDVGVVAGALTDESVVARSLGPIRRFLAASPGFVQSREPASRPDDLRSWPWLALASPRFGGAREVALFGPDGAGCVLPLSPVFIAEGVTSLREAARMGLGVAALPRWLIMEDIVTGRLVRVLPDWDAADLPAHIVHPPLRRLSLRARTFIGFAAAYMETILKA